MQSVFLPVTNSSPTIVDADIAERLGGRRLHLNARMYVGLRYRGRQHYLHRWILSPPAGKLIDHINGDPYDNRRANLRVTTHSENALNRHCRPKGVSGFRGVYKRQRPQRRTPWEVGFRIRGSSRWVGCFASRVVAAIFADRGLEELGVPSGAWNFPHRLRRADVPDFIEQTRGKFFHAVFVRRSDGTEREMLCRTLVNGRADGPGLKFDPAERSLASVYDINKRAHRFIDIEGVLCLTFAKKRYAVVP